MSDTLFIQCGLCGHRVTARVKDGQWPSPSAMVRMHEQAIAHIKRAHYRKPKPHRQVSE